MGEGKRKDQVRGFTEKISAVLDEDINTADILTGTKEPSDENLIECELVTGGSCPAEGETIYLLDRKLNKIEVIHGTNIIGHVTGTGKETLNRECPTSFGSLRGAALKSVIVLTPQFGEIFWVVLSKI